MYDEVCVFRYVTKGTFDAYNWSIIENKQKFISQVMTDGNVQRSCADIDEAVLGYAEMAAIASGNPLIKEKMEVDSEVSKLQLLKRNFISTRYNLEKNYLHILPERKEKYVSLIVRTQKDIEHRNLDPMFSGAAVQDEESPFVMTFQGRQITERKEAGELIKGMLHKIPADGNCVEFGEYAGFRIGVSKSFSSWDNSIEPRIVVIGEQRYTTDATMEGDIGNVMRLQNCVKGLDNRLKEFENKLQEVEAALVSTKEEYEKKFPKEDELNALLERQQELNSILMEEETKEEPGEEELPAEEAETSCVRHHRIAL
jgi:hypothetical protein